MNSLEYWRNEFKKISNTEAVLGTNERDVKQKIQECLNSVFQKERQRNIDNIQGVKNNSYYEEQSSIMVDFNGIQPFLKGVLQQRMFRYNDVVININGKLMKTKVLFKPAEYYERNIVRYVVYPERQPIHPFMQEGDTINRYGLYLRNNTRNWDLVTVLFDNENDYKTLYFYLLG